MKQTADDAAHEQHRNEHGGEGDGHGQDGEADLARALNGGLEGRFALFDVTHDVLEHDDGVVNDEADGKRQRHQRQIIEAVAEIRHAGKGPDHGDGQRQRRNEGGRHSAQEHENDADHQDCGDQQRQLDVVHRGADGIASIVNGLEFYRRRKLREKVWENFLDPVDDLNRVGAGLTLNREHDGALAPVPTRGADVLDAVDDRGDVLKAHRRAVAIRHHLTREIRGVTQLAVGADNGGAGRSVQGSGRHIDVRGIDRAGKLIDADLARRKRRRVDLDAHRVFLRTVNTDLRDTVQGRQLPRQQCLGIF